MRPARGFFYGIQSQKRTPLEYVILALAVAMSYWHLEIAYTGGYEALHQRSVTYIMGIALIYMIYREPKGGLWQNIVSGILFALAVSSVGYVVFQNDYFLGRIPLVDPLRPMDMVFGSICMLPDMGSDPADHQYGFTAALDVLHHLHVLRSVFSVGAGA